VNAVVLVVSAMSTIVVVRFDIDIVMMYDLYCNMIPINQSPLLLNINSEKIFANEWNVNESPNRKIPFSTQAVQARSVVYHALYLTQRNALELVILRRIPSGRD